MTIKFDGKKFASEKEKELKIRVSALNTTPTLVSILIGTDRGSAIYTNLKQAAAKRVGINFVVKKFPSTVEPEGIIDLIKKLNKDKKVNGIMVQLPLPPALKKQTSKILKTIAKEKDVDGLVPNSPYTPATVKAVRQILDVATKSLPYFGKKAAVVGASGTVGKAVVKELQKSGFKVCECDIDTRDLYAKLHQLDLIVSATGEPGLVKGEMVKEGVIAIDVGEPVGDFEKSISDRASFYTPVPGGVGPVTIVSLLENLVEAVGD
jgi:methylenetetrahydrofolate dehydrogenase (NADP+) / methenyltetrahydrofolate cyclohydrolase